VTVLNGVSSDLIESQFVPLVLNSVPYNVHGLIRMCTTEKFIYVADRALLYYKYDFQGTIDCIKVITVMSHFVRVTIIKKKLFSVLGSKGSRGPKTKLKKTLKTTEITRSPMCRFHGN